MRRPTILTLLAGLAVALPAASAPAQSTAKPTTLA